MKYLSVCAGIEAATVAWHPLGWEPVAFSEIERFPDAVLQHHYPDVPNYGDMTDHENWPTTDIDVLVGGTPCQSFSVAGLRKGMADPRGNLALVYLAIADQYRPRWLVWENVPGVLSSDGGRDFGAIVGGMVELGYSPCWRVLDAQYFGVAQRRRRVFIVASSRDWRDSAKVLLEPESLRRHPAPSREPGQDPANALTERPDRGGGNSEGQRLIPETVRTLTQTSAMFGYSDGTPPNLVPDYSVTLCRNGQGSADPELETLLPETMSTLNVTDATKWGSNQWINEGKAIVENQRSEVRESDQTNALAAGGGKPGQGYPAVREGLAVRRLTPLECERLQGFPDNYTNIPGASDTARWRALGNSMAVPVMHWIGSRISEVHKMQEGAKDPGTEVHTERQGIGGG